jgi:hypothetical protein
LRITELARRQIIPSTVSASAVTNERDALDLQQEPLAVLAKMRATPVNDIFATGLRDVWIV